MNIDLDSWEVGYADGVLGRQAQCAVNLNSFSYSTGYCEGRASHTRIDRDRSARRRPSRVPRLNFTSSS